jgi:large subunit ribosomal protein L22
MATRQREKAEKIAKERDKRPTAVVRGIRISVDKVKIVLDLIRGKDYEEAVAILNNTNKSASDPILKVLNSAAANAENNMNLPKDSLFVAQCWAGAGSTMKRMMPRARGRADQILKRTCQIRVILDQHKSAIATPKAAVKPAKKETVVKKETTAKPVPKTKQERPLTEEPNSKKPLGEKKAVPVKEAGSGKKSTSGGGK